MMYYYLINGTFAIAFLFERRGGDTALERSVPCPPLLFYTAHAGCSSCSLLSLSSICEKIEYSGDTLLNSNPKKVTNHGVRNAALLL